MSAAYHGIRTTSCNPKYPQRILDQTERAAAATNAAVTKNVRWNIIHAPTLIIRVPTKRHGHCHWFANRTTWATTVTNAATTNHGRPLLIELPTERHGNLHRITNQISQTTAATNMATDKHRRQKISHGPDSPHRIPNWTARAYSSYSQPNGTGKRNEWCGHYITQEKKNGTDNRRNQHGCNKSHPQLSSSDSLPNSMDNEWIDHGHWNNFPHGRHQ